MSIAAPNTMLIAVQSFFFAMLVSPSIPCSVIHFHYRMDLAFTYTDKTQTRLAKAEKGVVNS
ncbi:hypothetical protein PAT3040_02994 [Paenibacillus agaridevorans]|uniref:Uncharacterized protein n=1 Tax=Paenibacillus agaridevorans TaxID=171404 RepID=A0A2R5EX71_9BACL|nr:hypothetical protein PAT3040_02994 [Paenibacillus agaridevorans]